MTRNHWREVIGRSRRLIVVAVAALILTQTQLLSADTEVIKMQVWKTPTCGCCKAWVTYLEERGFEVETFDLPEVTSIKRALGLTDPNLHSCHTAKVGGYIVEGHVPERDIRRMLKEQPEIAGLTAPGMPMMSPGMNSIEPKGYDVIAFDRDQKTKVYSRY